ncbi:MAG TPA: PilZ domain-containing protein [Desulfobacteraceae bacterium]|nr:PilZ domain-containing protein [Desulfobacteraceae bacterium]
MVERRKYPRYSEQLHLTIYVYDTISKRPDRNGFKAMSLEGSHGGFRIESPRELPSGSLVLFESDDDASALSKAGTAEVRWCKPAVKSGFFEFGISFPAFVPPR